MQDDEIEIDLSEQSVFEDRIAARTAAYTELYKAVAAATDEEMRKEGMTMLSRVRNSFKAPAGELVQLPGGRQS
jgi:hypothetical protein